MKDTLTEEVLAADGLPISIGDVVTRKSDASDIPLYYFSRYLIRGTVVDITPGSITVEFEGGGKYTGKCKGCPPGHLVHLESPTFDLNLFNAMLGIGGIE